MGGMTWMTLGADGHRGKVRHKYITLRNKLLSSFSSDEDTFDWILADSTPTPNTGPTQAFSGTKE